MTTLIAKLDRSLYPHYARNWDDELFRQRILRYLTGDTVALDLGAGAGIVAYSAETGQPFQRKLDTCSAANWTAVPGETGQSERSDAWDGCYVRAGGHLRQCLVMRSVVSV